MSSSWSFIRQLVLRPFASLWGKKPPAPTKQEAGTSLEAMENKKHLLLLLET